MKESDQVDGCNSNNLVMPCSSNFPLKTQVKSKEGEHMFLVSTHLLQDSIDKDRMHYDREAYKFSDICIREDIRTNWIHGHVSSHSFSFHYFGNPVCCRIVKNQFQAQSTPSTTFHQEGEDDEDMTSMHTTTAWRMA